MRPSVIRWIERGLIAIGVACLLVYTISEVGAARYREQQTTILAEALSREEPPASSELPASLAPHEGESEPLIEEGAAIGLLEIPRLGLSTPILSGEDEQTLNLGAGHLRDTPSPWEEGNSAVAGHRDGVFRPLRHIRAGDRIALKTLKGNFSYVVTGTRVVMPDDLSVLDPGETSVLTLITCYPFNYVGPAPKRFIVRAERAPQPAPEQVAERPPR